MRWKLPSGDVVKRPTAFKGSDGTGYPRNTLELWSESDLMGIGVEVLEDEPTPEPEPDSPELELARLDAVISRDIEDLVSVLTTEQQEAFYAKTDNAPEGRRKRVAMERKKVLRATL